MIKSFPEGGLTSTSEEEPNRLGALLRKKLQGSQVAVEGSAHNFSSCFNFTTTDDGEQGLAKN
jgi:hypothetical protein